MTLRSPLVRGSLVLFAAAAILLAFVLVGLWIYIPRAFFYPDVSLEHERLTPRDLGWDYETVTIPSEDGTRLAAWWLPGTSGSRTAVVFLHGNALDRRVASRVRTVGMLREMGHHVLSLDYRGYGESEGRPTHAGVLADVHAAVQWTTERPEVAKIVLYGHSLGGALALCAAKSSDAVVGVATQGAFHSARGMVRHGARSLLGDTLAGWVASGLFDSPIEPLECVEDLEVPVLLMHGARDYVIPPSASRRLYEALGPEIATLWVEREGLHVEAMEVSPGRYRARMGAFLGAAFEARPLPAVRATWVGGAVQLSCEGRLGETAEVEVHLWDARDRGHWERVEVTCPEANAEIEPGFEPIGAAALPALPADEPTGQGRRMLEELGVGEG